jgi:branched-chain amino acid transport system substrate-binding protein
MRKSLKLTAVLGSVAILAAACGGSSSGGGTSAGTASSSAAGGASSSAAPAGGGKALTISVDLPFQGAQADTSKATVQAIQLYLDSVGDKAGAYSVKLTQYDDSTAAKGAWDDSTCSANAKKHVQTTDEVAVMGTFNSGCAKLEVPILEQAPGSPMLMVSHANTNPGLTKTWDPGEPAKYYPKGVRNYARVVPTDDFQGAAAARFVAQDLKLKKCYILNDNQTYGIGVARAFQTEATKQGITILGNESWDAKSPNYTSVFNKIKAKGPDCIYIGGIIDNNGGQLVKDKVKILGPNSGSVKLIGPDGFEGSPDLQKLAEAQGMYLTFPGLASEQLIAAGGPAKAFLDSYKAKYGALPTSAYAIYGVQAVQVILAAIAKSDGTRKGVLDAVFSGDGITIPAAQSMVGKDIKIDPKTGDVNALDYSVLIIKNNAESFFKLPPPA